MTDPPGSTVITGPVAVSGLAEPAVGAPAGLLDAVPMDITTVNDRHLYECRVVVQDPADPARPIEMPGRIVRFGPAGWLTVVAGLTQGAEIELYPVERVMAITGLREVAATG